MHFWIDKRASQVQYGRRRPGTFYAGRPSGLGRARDKTLTSVNSQTSLTAANNSSRPGSSFCRNPAAINNQRLIQLADTRDVHVNQRDGTSRGGSSGRIPYSSGAPQNQPCVPAGRGIYDDQGGRSGRADPRIRCSSLPGIPHEHQREDMDNQSVEPQDYVQDLTISSTPSDIMDPKWTRTKRIGLTLCFMAFILLGTVAAKLIIEGPSMIDAARGRHEASPYYFLITEVVFVVFAVALFFTGVACLRKRTNDYLMRQFQQHILHTAAGVSSDLGGSRAAGHMESSSNLTSSPFGSVDFLEYNGLDDPSRLPPAYSFLPGAANGDAHCQVHHHLICHTSNGSSPSRGGAATAHPVHCIHAVPTPRLLTFATQNPDGAHHQHQRQIPRRHRPAQPNEAQQPPPYHIALYLPLPKDTEDEIKAVNHPHHSHPINNSAVKQTHPDPQEEFRRGGTMTTAQERGGPDGASRAETPPPSYDEFAMDKV